MCGVGAFGGNVHSVWMEHPFPFPLASQTAGALLVLTNVTLWVCLAGAEDDDGVVDADAAADGALALVFPSLDSFILMWSSQ